MKICSKCKEDKPLSEFNKRSSAPDGLRAKCKDCCKQWYIQHPRPKRPCIYIITCLTNGKRYIGSTSHFDKRKNDHIGRLNREVHPNSDLQLDWNKQGKEAFKFEVLKEYDTIEEARASESHNILIHYDSLYNVNL